jgi:hypothetical protein
MRTMTCNQLGGACDKAFHAETFEEMTALAKQHAEEMIAQNDPAHMKAMNTMKETMESPTGLQEWMDEKREAFEAIPEDK